MLATQVKTSSMPMPVQWASPPRMLQRTTAECIWQALAAATPLGPWDDLPPAHVVKWLILVWCADEAASNKRLYAQAEVTTQSMRPGVVTMFSPCMLHIMHRSIVPIMKVYNCVNDLFRAAHVFQVASYWSALVKSVRRWLDKQVVVLHHAGRPNPEHRKVAEHLLRLTLCKGLPDTALPQKTLDLKGRLLDCMSGDWTSNVITYRCLDSTCPGGPACKKTACDAVMSLLLKVLFAKKVVIPSMNRWWKFTPVAQQVLMGVGIHGVWAHSVPSSGQRAAPAAPQEMEQDAEEAVAAGAEE
jgi:hypothetical protein